MKYFFARTVSKLEQFAPFSSRNIPSKWELLIISAKNLPLYCASIYKSSLGGPFEIGATLACRQQAGKLPRRTSRRNTTLRRVARTAAVLLYKKNRKHTKWVGAPIRVQPKSNKRRCSRWECLLTHYYTHYFTINFHSRCDHYSYFLYSLFILYNRSPYEEESSLWVSKTLDMRQTQYETRIKNKHCTLYPDWLTPPLRLYKSTQVRSGWRTRFETEILQRT